MTTTGGSVKGRTRLAAYRALVRTRLQQATLAQIRETTNKASAPGDRRFNAKVQRLTGRRAALTRRDGDQKSEAFRETAKINRV